MVCPTCVCFDVRERIELNLKEGGWGVLGCVGCGQCVHACLVNIASPVNAYNRLAKEVK